jgi:hypothetical protein
MKVQIDLPPEIYEQILVAAREGSLSVGEVIARVLKCPSPASRPHGFSIVGRYSSEADLIDEVCEEAMSDRERIPMRMP